MTAIDPYIKALGRILLSLMFLSSGVQKAMNYAGTSQYMEKNGVPGGLLFLVIALEILAPLAIIIGWKTRWAALALAGFCFLSALLFHFDFGDRTQMIMFMKNVTIAGGFLVLAAAGPGALSVDKD